MPPLESGHEESTLGGLVGVTYWNPSERQQHLNILQRSKGNVAAWLKNILYVGVNSFEKLV